MPNAYSTWRAQSPRPDFAERTVAAILRDRTTSRPASRPRRWIGAFAMAGVLIAAGALAWAAIPRAAGTVLSAPSIVRADTGPRRESPPVVQAPAVPRSSTETPAPIPRIPAAKAPRHKEAVPTNKGGRVNLPRCGCGQMICDCVEPQ
jgi:hypothetical protein